MTTGKGGLGRGLGALMKEMPRPAAGAARAPAGVPPAAAAPAVPPEAVRIPAARIRTGGLQPRRHFRTEPLDDLVRSIRERGILQPLLVRPAGDGFELIAGERRLRAAQQAGLTEVPARIMRVDDREALELALIENLQREDLDPIEEADGYRLLGERFQLTQEQIAERVGKARATVANALRLLSLPDGVRHLIEDRALSVGHAKVLLGLTAPAEQALLAGQTVAAGWSVRELERRVARLHRAVRTPRASRADVPEAHLQDLADKLRQKLGTAVRVRSSATRANGKKTPGAVEIEYYTADDLDRLMLILGISEEF